MANEVKTEKDRLQALEILRNSYQMYERSKNETTTVRRNKKDKNGNRIYTDESIEETLDLIKTAQGDIVDKYVALGGDANDLKNLKLKRYDKKSLLTAIETANQRDAMKEYAKRMLETGDFGEEADEVDEEPVTQPEQPQVNKIEEIKKDLQEKVLKEEENQPKEQKPNPGTSYNATMNKASYDIVKLPSGGECYKSKIKEVMVSYLTAYDENLILSPNLYRNGTFLEHILKNKVLDDIDVGDLVQGDRDAILIWLRASGYGNEYPITVTDGETGVEFDTVADLTELSFKKFDLKGDKDGYFDYKLPVTGDIVKFKFLTANDNKKLDKMREEDGKTAKIATAKKLIRNLRENIENNDMIDKSKYNLIKNAIETLENEIINKFNDLPEDEYTHELTNRLILSTISINGNKDREFIVNYLLNLNVKDAASYRKYIIDNEPGIDYNIKVKRPDSLGGGYIETFLQLDQFIFVSGI